MQFVQKLCITIGIFMWFSFSCANVVCSFCIHDHAFIYYYIHTQFMPSFLPLATLRVQQSKLARGQKWKTGQPYRMVRETPWQTSGSVTQSRFVLTQVCVYLCYLCITALPKDVGGGHGLQTAEKQKLQRMKELQEVWV